MEQGDIPIEPLYSHLKRPRWGLAILAAESDDKREYQFQDGEARTIKEGFWDLMQQVDQPADRAQKIVRELKGMVRASRSREAASATVKVGPPPIAFEEQIGYLRKQYPEGLASESWIAKVRGSTDEATRRSRHRDPAIAHAQEALAKEALEALIAAGEFGEIKKRIHQVLTATDLTASSDTAPLRKLPEEAEEELASHLMDLLYGAGPYASRFDRFATGLAARTDERVRWPMASALSALVHPQEHVCIKPSVFREQARAVAPTFRYTPTPSGAGYVRLLEVAKTVRAQLEGAGEPVRDLMDVFDFIHVTLRPKARQVIEAARPPAI
ncbi:MAG: hypothetical protein H6719_00340 [Sandaracinaceae bacterium]|nr:hypothetical protein [Sandaracinaceae bacterium]